MNSNVLFDFIRQKIYTEKLPLKKSNAVFQTLCILIMSMVTRSDKDFWEFITNNNKDEVVNTLRVSCNLMFKRLGFTKVESKYFTIIFNIMNI